MKLKNIFLLLFIFNTIILSAQQIEYKDIIGTFNFDSEHYNLPYLNGNHISISFCDDSTFSYIEVDSFTNTCIIDMYSGSFSYENNTIHLKPEIHQYHYCNYNDREVNPDTTYEDKEFFIPRYLIATAYQHNLYLLEKPFLMIHELAFIHFINSINAQSNSQINELQKPIHYSTSIENVPLPKEWKEKIHTIPIEVKIKEVKNWKTPEIKYFGILNAPITTTYKINKGTKDNIFVGMNFWHSDQFCNLKILEVYENYSIGSANLTNKCSCKKGFVLSSKYLGDD